MQFSENRRLAGMLFKNLIFEISNLKLIFGGHKAVVRPVPIPNTAVKLSLADGSGFIDSARVGCRQFFCRSRNQPVSAFFISNMLGQFCLAGGEDFFVK